MKYIVMECHLSYAVVLDEEGRFLNVANRHYEVGQTVTDVIEMQDSQPAIKAKTRYKWIGSIAAMAACLILIVISVFQFGALPYASVYMTINPEVRIDVNKQDIVVDVEGINEDGRLLIKGYSYKKKDLNLVMDELIDRAVEMGFLHEGSQVTLTLDAHDDEWVVTKSDSLDVHLNEYLADKLSVTVEITNKRSGNSVITMPIEPNGNTSDTEYGDSDYGEITSPPSEDAPKPDADNQADYDNTDDGSHDDGETDEGDSDYGASNGRQTDYEDEDNGGNDDGDGDTDENGESNYDG